MLLLKKGLSIRFLDELKLKLLLGGAIPFGVEMFQIF